MISKSQIKLITSLQQKKYRIKTGLFVAEGPKIIGDLLSSGMKLHSIYATEVTKDFETEVEHISAIELKKISSLKTANTMLAVFHIPDKPEMRSRGIIVALDAVRDPGNLGTIIRLCDWFGVEQLVCSNGTVDCYNPKVVQATMGSIARVNVYYTDLSEYVKNTQLPVYAAVMTGVNVYELSIPEEAVVVMGNEANGISSELLELIENKVTIPNFGNADSAESLNVATATAIMLSEFRRNTQAV